MSLTSMGPVLDATNPGPGLVHRTLEQVDQDL